MIRQTVRGIILDAMEKCRTAGVIPSDFRADPIIETPREENHGDYSTNIAFFLAPKLRKGPREIAGIIIDAMDYLQVCDRVEVAGKGFINFYVKNEIWFTALGQVYRNGVNAYMPAVGQGKKVLIEFVSANPTGPLHIGHGRGAAVGDVLGNILKHTGYSVTKEYYVNDAGRQIRTLGESTYTRWKQLQGEDIPYPADYYQGDYVRDLALAIISDDTPVPGDTEAAVRFMSRYASDHVMAGIQKDLEDFGVHFDNYYRETSLFDEGIIDGALSLLKEKGYAYEKDGALWFRTSAFGGDEDRVLIKSGGEKTYFTSDIAYHSEKFKRGYDLLIDMWGSDHHGYIPRLNASLEALGYNKDALKIMLIQFVTLLKDGKPVGMSTRSGQFTTLREVLDEVGKDAARYFFLMRKSDAHLEFDLDLAKKTSNENPVYYIQYAHARISSIFRTAAEQGIDATLPEDTKPALLVSKEEIDLIKGALRFYDVIEGSAKSLEPHRISFYLLDLAGRFHSYYNKTRVLVDDKELMRSRLLLVHAVQEIFRTGLEIVGIEAPERM